MDMQRTTIALSPAVRDRLKNHGRKGDSYEDILVALMDAVDPSQIATVEPITHQRPMAADELNMWRKKTASEKVALASRMRRLAMRNNPQGYRSLVASPKNRKIP